MHPASHRRVGPILTVLAVSAAGLAVANARQPDPSRQAPNQPGPRQLSLAKHDSTFVSLVRFSPDGARVAVFGEESKKENGEMVVTLWETSTGRHVRTLRGADANGLAIAFSPDSKRFAVAGGSEITILDAATGMSIRRIGITVDGIRFSPDGKLIATTGDDIEDEKAVISLRVWDATTGRQVFALKLADEHRFRWVTFARDGRLLAATTEGDLRVWDPAIGRERTPIRLPGDQVGSTLVGAEVSEIVTQDGGRLLMRNSARPRLVDTAMAKELLTYGRAGDGYHSAAFSPDGSEVIAGAEGGRVVIWNTTTGAERVAFQGAELDAEQWALARFTPDGRYVVVYWDKDVPDRISPLRWSALFTRDGRLVRRLRGVKTIVFDPSMRSVAVVTGTPYEDRDLPPDRVTIYDAATWLDGGAKKD